MVQSLNMENNLKKIGNFLKKISQERQVFQSK